MVTTSKVMQHGGVPTLFINGVPQASMAYITYLSENNCYADFAHAGYKLFSFPVYFGGRGINIISKIKPFSKGIYDNKGKADFSIFDDGVELILQNCPDALIFPRVNMMLPAWWEEENPHELNYLANGQSCRESFSSKKWKAETQELLAALIEHINTSSFADHIVGYQLADGFTEEWFHFDLRGGRGKPAEDGFCAFIQEKYPAEAGLYKGLPNDEVYAKSGEIITDNHTIRFLEYASFVVAEAVCDFARLAKKLTQNRLIVGTFYGYTMEVTNPAYGHLALSRVLGCGDIDFICSPVSYINTRAPGIDWANMSVIDSIKHHGKLYFAECDIRTYLTKSLAESRLNSCEPGTYTGGVWQGPKSPEISRRLLLNSFARQLTHGCGLWWFDMWGGWYKDDLIMQDMGEYMKIAAIALADNKRESIAEAAVFVDETAYKYLNPNSPTASRRCSENRLPLGLAGAPYDIYDIADFETSISKYKAVIFLAPVKTEAIDSAINTCRMKNIGMLVAGRENPTLEAEQIREFYVENSIHIFCETNDVINVCKNYISIHAGSAGEKILLLGKTRKITPLLKTGNEIYYSDKIVATLQEFETRLYRLD